ncbi:hypothetical protein Tco_0022315, partial [Tanacetum coccineum]
GIDVRVVAETVVRDEIATDVRDMVEGGVDWLTHLVIKSVQREQGHKIIGVELAIIALTKRVAELERDNSRLRGTVSVKAEAMEARKAAMNLEPLNEIGDKQEGDNDDDSEGGGGGNVNGRNGNGGHRGNENGGNGNGGRNGNENGNGNHGMNNGGFMPMARECTFQEFL